MELISILGPTGVRIVLAGGIGLLLIIMTYLVGSSLGCIAKTGLYVYTTEGNRPDQIADVDFAEFVR